MKRAVIDPEHTSHYISIGDINFAKGYIITESQVENRLYILRTIKSAGAEAWGFVDPSIIHLRSSCIEANTPEITVRTALERGWLVIHFDSYVELLKYQLRRIRYCTSFQV